MQYGWLILALAGCAANAITIDVSHHQGRIDWEKVKAAGVTMAIAKATEGDGRGDLNDAEFERNWKGMKENGIKAGAYHYLRGEHSVQSQVSNLRNRLRSVNFGADDLLAIDVEGQNNAGVSADKMADTLKGVLDELKKEYRNLWIYTGPYYWEDNVAWRKHDFSGYKLWISHYTSDSRPRVPTTWKTKGYSLWQYSRTGRVDGITENVDMDRSDAAENTHTSTARPRACGYCEL